MNYFFSFFLPRQYANNDFFFSRGNPFFNCKNDNYYILYVEVFQLRVPFPYLTSCIIFQSNGIKVLIYEKFNIDAGTEKKKKLQLSEGSV